MIHNDKHKEQKDIMFIRMHLFGIEYNKKIFFTNYLNGASTTPNNILMRYITFE